MFEVTETHPVESVSSSDALLWLHRVGLDLSTEAQWEYAARAGTGSPWPFGRNGTVEGHANMCDESTIAYDGPRTTDDLNDTFPAHAPVGSFAANPFGLHDMFGNVEEWCRDWRASYTDPLDGGDGRGEGLREVAPEEQTARARRGRSWSTTWRSTGRASFRGFAKPDDSGDRVGIRVARRLDR